MNYQEPFLRSRSLNNIPNKKVYEKILLLDSIKDVNSKNVKTIAYNRYAESNVPIEYWDLKMEKDFVGDPRLLTLYNEYIADIKTNYLSGKSICLAGAHGLGKQLALDTELPTPNGFIKLSELKENDQLFDENGNICNVVKLHPINISPESYEITFDDGTKVEACADHLWLTYTRESKFLNKNDPEIRSTKELFYTQRIKKTNIANHYIPCCNPINYSKKDLLTNPYVFGYLIKHEKIENIPDDYLYSSYEQRLELLQGLLDTSGTCTKNGKIKYYSVFSNLANQVCQLVRSFGIKCNVKHTKYCFFDKKNNICSINKYYVEFYTKLPVFRLKIKNLSLNKLCKNKLSRLKCRFITNIKQIDPKPMRCITVDSPSYLFLITRSFIATHNTMASACILKKAIHKGFICQYTTLSDVVNVLTQAPSEEKYIARRELCLVDFLLIDEFDSRFIQSENAADLYARTLETIFRTRSQNKLPTLMCTNSPNIIETFTGPLKQSIDSLIKGYLKIFPVFGNDYRKK